MFSLLQVNVLISFALPFAPKRVSSYLPAQQDIVFISPLLVAHNLSVPGELYFCLRLSSPCVLFHTGYFCCSSITSSVSSSHGNVSLLSLEVFFLNFELKFTCLSMCVTALPVSTSHRNSREIYVCSCHFILFKYYSPLPNFITTFFTPFLN